MEVANALSTYREEIKLDQPFVPTVMDNYESHAYKDSISIVLNALLEEHHKNISSEMKQDVMQMRTLIRSLLTIRMPKPLDAEIMKHIDLILQSEKQAQTIVEALHLPNVQQQFGTMEFPKELTLWQGDISTLRADAIVNAANHQLLGCFQPTHVCIDNIIHTKAGPQLRNDCATIMSIQGKDELTGSAKITRGYHLPAKYVLHTVGPIVQQEQVTLEQQQQLASCYTSCLDLAALIPDIHSIAFCGISTGLFGYPKKMAAEVAVHAVCQWISKHPNRMKQIIFNVFKDEDRECYARVFAGR